MKKEPSSDQNLKSSIADILSNLTNEDLLRLKKLIEAASGVVESASAEKEISIPVSIFSYTTNPAEAIAKYLKENKNLRFCDISRLLKRKENTIWTNYKRAADSLHAPFSEKEDDICIPISNFRQNLSFLESIVVFLRDAKRLKNKEIAKLLNKNHVVLSIAYRRAKKKVKSEK